MLQFTYGLFNVFKDISLMIWQLFRFPWAEICQIFQCFFGKFKKSKRHSEINWPLAVTNRKNRCWDFSGSPIKNLTVGNILSIL